MDPCGEINTAEYNVGIWRDHFIGAFPQPQILDSELSVLYSTSTHSNPLDFNYATDTITSSYSPSPSGMTTPSDSSSVPSPTDSALSPFFLDAITPAALAPEPAKKPSHSRKRSPGHIPRPRNAFILFRSHYVAAQLIPQKVENDHRHISKIIGEIWNKLSPAERLIWEQKADIEKERHSRMYPDYRYKPAKPDGVVKRRVTCRGAPALSAYSSTPRIGKPNGPCEIIGSLNADKQGDLHFGNDQRARLTDQEERRRDKERCARVAQLVQQGIVGEKLEAEAQRLGLDRGSVASPTPQLQPSIHDPPGRRSQFHTNVDILRALQDEDEDVPTLNDLFASNNPLIPSQDAMLSLDSIVTSSVLVGFDSSVQTYVSRSPESEDDSAPPIIVSAPLETDDTLGGWPYRPALSPLATPPLAPATSSEQLLLVHSPAQHSESTPRPTQSSSSSPLCRHHRLYYPYPRRGWAQKKQVNGDLDSDSDLSTFDHVSYHSPANSPPEQYLSPHVHPRLQLDITAHNSNAPSPVSQPGARSPLYGIDPAHSGRPHEPIDLSAMYDQGDTATGLEATLHSTYAINAGKAYPPIPATPAPLSDIPIAQQHALTCRPVSNNATSSDFDVESGPSPTYYGWQSPFGSEPGYPRDIEYQASANATTYDAMPHIYYPDNTGAPY
ncbi:HMG (high mobility group) box protein [Rhizoctonia solani 123E]|uniref:HMG (High mobility group) box protein n=1 Tax=Rhizoctonia solani 123E TaxID=1423351 RepID=A0A074RV90_9AGAM|nr:HMG (high mobility group) box protein [Rhizoctonia solani 123E]